MRRFLTLLLLALAVTAAAQPVDTAKYAFPVRHVAGLYAANFGEIRPAHFHAGVDIKTDGVEGKELVAVADGYISRIVVTPSGYGRALYLTLQDGSTAVYGHLSRFRDDLEACMQADRYGRSSNNVDLYFPKGRFPVHKGELVGYSGDTGSSGGPHLHFELRAAGSERRINTVRSGMFRPKDTTPPLMLQLHYVQVDTVRGVALRSQPQSYNLVREAAGRYRTVQRDPLPVGPRGYFIIEVSDRRDGVSNTFGIWRLTARLDGEAIFEYRMDGFRYEQARFSDAVSWYARKLQSRNEVIRLARLTGAPKEFYPTLREQGVVRTEPNQTRTLCIEAEDDCGNISTLTCTIRGSAAPFRATADSTSLVLYPDRNNQVACGERLNARIPAGALYEALFYQPEELPQPVVTGTSGVAVLSPAVRILPAEVPLAKEVTIALRTEVPRPLRRQTVLAGYNPATKRLSYIGGSCAGDEVTARTRTTGWIVAVADTLAPTIHPQFNEGADLTRSETLRFRVSDNFAGVISGTLTIDGRWVPCDRLPMRGLIFHRFDGAPEHRTHTVHFTATDAAGNTARWEGTFYR